MAHAERTECGLNTEDILHNEGRQYVLKKSQHAVISTGVELARQFVFDIENSQTKTNEGDDITEDCKQTFQNIFHVTPDEWNAVYRQKGLKVLLTECKDVLRDIHTLSDTHQNISDNDVISRAFSGSALKGTLLTNTHIIASVARENVIECPSAELQKLKDHAEQGLIIEASTAHQHDGFRLTLETLGFTEVNKTYSTMKSMGIEGASKSTSTSKNADNHHSSEIRAERKLSSPAQTVDCYQPEERSAATVNRSDAKQNRSHFSRSKLISVPRATCSIPLSQVKLSRNALKELQKIGRLIDEKKDEDSIKQACGSFLRHYGSHLATSDLSFGGIFELQVKYIDDEDCNESFVRKMLSEVLEKCFQIMFTDLGTVEERVVKGEDLAINYDLGLNYTLEHLKKLEIRITMLGGPVEATSIPAWKLGVCSINDTWCLIDRGDSTSLTGVWELVSLHSDDLSNAQVLANYLRCAWNPQDNADQQEKTTVHSPKEIGVLLSIESKHEDDTSTKDSTRDSTTQRIQETAQESKPTETKASEIREFTSQSKTETDQESRLKTELVTQQKQEAVDTMSGSPTQATTVQQTEEHDIETNKTPESVQGPLEEDTTEIKVTHLINILGLNEFYPRKITLQDVMTLRKDERSNEPSKLPWAILKGLIMLDYRVRDGAVADISESASLSSDDESEGDQNKERSSVTVDKSKDITLNPLDVFYAIYQCCSLLLRQVLFEKMFSCKLAVPIFMYSNNGKSIEVNLWPLRTTIIEWFDKDQKLCEEPLLNAPCKIVSFVRLGRPYLSKSDLLNKFLFKAHSAFHSHNCLAGDTDRAVNGFVEGMVYIPGKKGTLDDVTMFCNLRGDGVQHGNMVQLLSTLSSVVVVVVNYEDMKSDEICTSLRNIHSKCPNVIVLLSSYQRSLRDTIKQKYMEPYHEILGKTKPNKIDAVSANERKIQEGLSKKLQLLLRKVDAEQFENGIKRCNHDGKLDLDEYDEECVLGKELATQLMSIVQKCNRKETRNEMLPLQGEHWKKISKLLKQDSRFISKPDTPAMERDKIRNDMISQRNHQLAKIKSSSDIAMSFIKSITQYADQGYVLEFYFKWLKMEFDQRCRKQLPDLHRRYKEACHQHRNAKENKEVKDEELKQLETNVVKYGMELEGSVIGLEHLFREIGQFYEAAMTDRDKIGTSIRSLIDRLPTSIAKLILRGHTLEIMDGDASNIAMTWVNDVLKSLQTMKGHKKVLVISVLGVQSSGKSTLLNTMFGMQFAVSAGRCTKGVFSQLLPVQASEHWKPNFDYVLIVDTEGIRAPELGLQKQDHDNELATLTLGLGDMTIINIKGENTEQMKDALQIAMHAFLRMRMADANFKGEQKCVFIHNNVSAISAEDKIFQAQQTLEKTLDTMIIEAAKQESNCMIRSFREVIDIDLEHHVWYFRDLWEGSPPMAPVNPNYAEDVAITKDCLIFDVAKSIKSCLNIPDLGLRIKDLWNAILAEDFIFSFRNSLESKAYLSIQETFFSICWAAKAKLMEWLDKECAQKITLCNDVNLLDSICTDVISGLGRKSSEIKQDSSDVLEKVFTDSEYAELVIQWKQSKKNELAEYMKEVESSAKIEIEQKKSSRGLEIMNSSSDARIEKTILDRAKSLAENYKDCGQISEDKAQQEFDKMWPQWVRDLIPSVKSDRVDIHKEIENALYRQFSDQTRLLRTELEQHPFALLAKEQCKLEKLEHRLSLESIKDEYLEAKRSFKEMAKKIMIWRKSDIKKMHSPY